MRLIGSACKVCSRRGPRMAEKLEIDPQGRLLIDSDLRQLGHLEKEIEQLDKQLAREAYASEPVKLLMTLPGVGRGRARRCWPPGATSRASPTPTMPPATWAWRLPRSNRPTTVTTARSPSRQQPGPLDADRGGAARGQASRPAGLLLPPPGEEEELQRGRGGGGAEAGHDRLADAQEQRALPLRPSAEHGDQAGGCG